MSATVVPDLKQRLLESYSRRGGRHTEENSPVPLTPSAHLVHTPANFEVHWVLSYLVSLFCFVWSCVKKPICWRKAQNLKSEMVQQWLNELQTSGFLSFFFFFFFAQTRGTWCPDCDPNTTFWFINDSKQNSHKFRGATSTTVVKNNSGQSIQPINTTMKNSPGALTAGFQN